MCGCEKESCHKCNHKKELSCGVKKSNDGCHNHSFRDITFNKDICSTTQFKALGIDKGMNGDEVITIIVKLLYSVTDELNKLKIASVANESIRRKTFYIINGGAKPEVGIVGGLQNGDVLFENNTGNSLGITPTIYEWNGFSWVLISDLK